MSDIIKTEAIVLSKLKYSETSIIVTFYTDSYGKLSAIIKGGRNPKSKMAMIVDPLNHLQIILYKKDTRDVQILSSADIISHYARIKEDLNTAKYSFAIIELIKNLTSEHETNHRLFKGLVRILNHLERKTENPAILYGRFFLFFLSELGYEIAVDKCGICSKLLDVKNKIGFNFESGFSCSDCTKFYLSAEIFSAELFEYIICLKNNMKAENLSVETMDKTNLFLERYLKHHIADFKGIQSFHIYN